MQDTIRFLAALAVVLAHHSHFATMYPLYSIPSTYAPPFYNYLNLVYVHGGYAVFVFFFLSGFMISKTQHEKGIDQFQPRNFMIRRCARIYPAHLVSLLTMTALTGWWELNSARPFISYNNDAWHFVLNLLLINNWGLGVDNSFNVPAWSLSVEFLCYAIISLLLAWRGRFNFSFFIFLFAVILTQISSDPSVRNLGNGIAYFITGYWTSILYRPLQTRLMITLFIIGSTLFYVSLDASLGLQKVIWMFAVFPIFMTIIYHFDNTISILKSRPLKFIGDFSFSLYIWHFPVQALIYCVMGTAMKDNMNSLSLWTTYIVFSLGAAYWSMRILEPRLGKRILTFQK